MYKQIDFWFNLCLIKLDKIKQFDEEKIRFIQIS